MSMFWFVMNAVWCQLLNLNQDAKLFILATQIKNRNLDDFDIWYNCIYTANNFMQMVYVLDEKIWNVTKYMFYVIDKDKLFTQLQAKW